MKQSLFGVWFALVITLCTAHSTEDPLRDTLWIRQMPLGGQNFSKPLFHPNGKTVFTTSDQYMFEYDVATGELLKTRETKSQRHISDYVLTSDSQFIIVSTIPELVAVGDCEIEVWHVDSGFVKEKKFSGYGFPKSLALSPDDTTLYVGFTTPSLYRINLEKMLIEKQESEYGFGEEIALSPDGKTLISTVRYFQGGDNTVSGLLDSESFKLLKILPDYLYAPTFNTTGELIGGYTSRGDVPYTYYIGLYDLRDKSFHRLGVNMGIQYAGYNIAFTKNNKYIVATRDLGGYSVWDIATKKPLYEAPYETRGYGFSISDDNSTFCTIGANSIALWKFKDPSLNSIDETLPTKSIALYPNPTQSSVTVIFPGSAIQGSYTIYDMQGGIVMTSILGDEEIQKGMVEISTESLCNGVYIFRLRLGSMNTLCQLYIQR